MSSASRRLLKSTSIYGLGSVLINVGALLLIPLYTRLFPPAENGIIMTANVLSNVLLIAFGLGLEGALARFYFDVRDDAAKLRKLVSTLLLTVAVFAATLTTIILVAGHTIPFFRNFNGIAFNPYIQIVVVSSFFAVLNTLPLSYLQVQERAKAYALITFGRFLVTTALIIYFVVVLRQGVLGSLLGTLIGYAIFAVICLVILAPQLSLRWDRARAIEGLRFGLPLMPHSLAHWTLSLSDRLILLMLLGTSSVGIYSLGYNLGMGMQVVVAAFTAAWGPVFYDRMERDPINAPQELGRVIMQVIAGLMLLALLVAILSREIVMIMSTPPYFDAARVMPWIVFAYFLNGLYICYVNVLFFFKRTKILPFITGGVAVTNVLLNLWLVPRFGYIAAAWNTVLAYAITSALTYHFSRQSVTLPVDSTRLWRLGAVCLFAFAGAQWLSLPNPWLSLLLKSVAFALLVTVLFFSGLLPRAVLNRLPLVGRFFPASTLNEKNARQHNETEPRT